jgi:GTPase
MQNISVHNHNLVLLQQWNKDLNNQNTRALLTIGLNDNGKVMLLASDQLGVQQLADVLQQLADRMKHESSSTLIIQP